MLQVIQLQIVSRKNHSQFEKKRKLIMDIIDLQLSILLVGANSSTTMTASADISQGFSFQKSIGGATVYEHQLNVKCFFLYIIWCDRI